MLALMPQAVPSDMQSYTTGMTVSTPYTISQSACTTSKPSININTKRPKLSLNTTEVPSVIGSRSTSLRLETLSVTTPTSRNTFSNAWEPTPLVSTTNSTKSLHAIEPVANERQDSPISSTYIDTATPVTTSSTAATSAHSGSSSPVSEIAAPYRISFNISSILVNGPVLRKRKRTTRQMFPLTKQVTFRVDLTEDIQTKTYIYAHSDIESSTSAMLPESKAAIRKALGETSSDTARGLLQLPQSSLKRDSPSSDQDSQDESDENEDHEICPVTPVAGRRKRRREWVWTLGPPEAQSDITSQS